MSEYQRFRVTGKEGLRGTVFATSRLLDESKYRLLRLEDGREFLIPAETLELREDGTYFLRLPERELEPYARSAKKPETEKTIPAVNAKPAPPDKIVVPAVEEQLEVDKRTIETGRVRVHKNVSETEMVVDEPLIEDEYEVTHVPVDGLVDGPVEMRQEGDTIIVPVLEEVLIVEKRLILREEVHITKKRRERHDPKKVTLRKEEVKVERVKPAGS